MPILLPAEGPSSDPVAEPAALLAGLRALAVVAGTAELGPEGVAASLRLCLDVIDAVLRSSVGLTSAWCPDAAESTLLLHESGRVLSSLSSQGALGAEMLGAAFVDLQARFNAADAAEPTPTTMLVPLRHALELLAAAFAATGTDASAAWFGRCAMLTAGELGRVLVLARAEERAAAERESAAAAAEDAGAGGETSDGAARRAVAASLAEAGRAAGADITSGRKAIPSALWRVLIATEEVAEAVAARGGAASSIVGLGGHGGGGDGGDDDDAAAADGSGGHGKGSKRSRHGRRHGKQGSSAAAAAAAPAGDAAATDEDWTEADRVLALLMARASSGDDLSAELSAEDHGPLVTLSAEAALSPASLARCPRPEAAALLAWALVSRVLREASSDASAAAELSSAVTRHAPVGTALSLAAACCRTLDRARGPRLGPSDLRDAGDIAAAAWDFGIGATGDAEEVMTSSGRPSDSPSLIEASPWTLGDAFLPASAGEAGAALLWPALGGGSREALQLRGAVLPGWLEGAAGPAAGSLAAAGAAAAAGWLLVEPLPSLLEGAFGAWGLAARAGLCDPLGSGVVAASPRAVADPFASLASATVTPAAAGAASGVGPADRRARAAAAADAARAAPVVTAAGPSASAPWALANETLFALTSSVPGAVKEWAGRPRRTRKREQIQSHFADDVSPRLRHEQLCRLAEESRAEGWTSGSFVVRALPSAGEFTAAYTVDDVTLRLSVALPDEYPLRRVKVQLSVPAGIEPAKWRRWEMQLLTLLSAHNGRFADAVRTWKRSIDREFEGVEPCPVCYSVISLGDKTVPRMQCSVCRNKFHNSCLFRWFQTSGDSKCPMCRSAFY